MRESREVGRARGEKGAHASRGADLPRMPVRSSTQGAASLEMVMVANMPAQRDLERAPCAAFHLLPRMNGTLSALLVLRREDALEQPASKCVA